MQNVSEILLQGTKSQAYSMPTGTEECLRELDSLEFSSLSHGYDVTQGFHSLLQFSIIMNRKLSKHDLCSSCSYDISKYVLKINDDAMDCMKFLNNGTRGGGEGIGTRQRGKNSHKKLSHKEKRLKKKLKCTKYKLNPHMKGI